MIDRRVFEEWMTELDAHFPGERSEKILAVYWRALRDRLTTEEFEAGCVEVLGAEEFFPPWRWFLRDDTDTEAAGQWELVRRALENWRRGLPEEATEETRRVVGSMGGLRALAMQPEQEVQWTEKRFTSRYGQDDEEPDRLPPISEKGRKLIEGAMEGRTAMELAE